MTKREKIETLADEVQAWSYQKKMIGHAGSVSLRDDTMSVQVKHRAALRRAQRFVIDDDATRLACRLSHEHDRMAAFTYLARLPYDTIWLEYSIHAKIKEFEAMGSLSGQNHQGAEFDPARMLDEVPPRGGYLLTREQPEGSCQRWVCHEFLDHMARGDGIAIGMVAYVFNPDGDPKFPVRGSSTWRAPTLSLIPEFPRMAVSVADAETGAVAQFECAPEYSCAGMVLPMKTSVTQNIDGSLTVVDPDAIRGPAWFDGNFAVIIEPWWQSHFTARFDNPKDRARTYNIILYQMRENAGHLRWLIALLAAINGLPRDVRAVTPKPGRRTFGMNSVPFLGYSNLSVSIPRENRLQKALDILDPLTEHWRNRRHSVMGHWRVIDRGKRQSACRHMPVGVENDVAECSVCGLRVRWIKAHERGDATKGYVKHEYKVGI